MIPSLNKSMRAGVLVAVVAMLVVPVANASSGASAFSGTACSLFTAKQVAAIVGDAKTGKYKCVPSRTVNTGAGPTYAASAGSGKPAGGGYFVIEVVKYKSATIESRVKQMFKARLKPVKGVGDWAYARFTVAPIFGGKTADTGQFVFGAKGYGVLITVRAKLKKTVTQPALKALAKKIVGEL